MTRRIMHIYAVLLVALSCAVGCQIKTDDPQDKIWVVAHRANTGEGVYPENSIEAVRSCIEHGLDIIEIDVRQTLDGAFVVLHDSTLDRTTNGNGNIKDFTLDDVRKLKLTHNGEVTESVIPTLQEVFNETKGKIMLDLDIKLSGDSSYKRIVELAAKHDILNEVLIFLYDKDDIEFVQGLADNVRILPRARLLADIDELRQSDSIDIIHIDEDSYDDREMETLIDNGIRVWINALGKYDKAEKNGENGFRQLFSSTPHVNVIQTDLAIQLKNYLKENKLTY